MPCTGEHRSDDQPGEVELRPLLREALAALREMQQYRSVRPKLKEFAEGKLSAAKLKEWLGNKSLAHKRKPGC